MQTIYYDLRDTKGQQKEIEDKISAAAKILREGGLVGIPTETVYGLGANGLDGKAVKRIFEAKGRPQDNPLILHVTGPQWLPRYCADIPPIAYVLARYGQAVGNDHLVWWCYPMAEVASLLVTLVFFRRLYRTLISRIPEHGASGGEKSLLG